MVTTTREIIKVEPRIKRYCPNCQKEWWVTKNQKTCPLCDEWLKEIGGKR